MRQNEQLGPEVLKNPCGNHQWPLFYHFIREYNYLNSKSLQINHWRQSWLVSHFHSGVELQL